MSDQDILEIIMPSETDWSNFYIGQLHRAALELRSLDQRVSWASLQKLRDAKRCLDVTLERAEEHERKAEDGRPDQQAS